MVPAWAAVPSSPRIAALIEIEVPALIEIDRCLEVWRPIGIAVPDSAQIEIAVRCQDSTLTEVV